MDAKEALKWAKKELKDVSEPEKSAEFLLRQVLTHSLCHSREGGNLDIRAWILANPDYKLTQKQEEKFKKYIERRKKHEPVWYITGHIEFYGLDLEVNENVLIPRPETEFLVEEVLSVIPAPTSVIPARQRSGKHPAGILDPRVKPEDDISILELGTGSGAISLALTNELKKKGFWTSQNDVKIMASDISGDALKVAKKNAKSLGLERLINFREGDLFEPWQDERFDIVVANLPYIPHEEISTLALDIHHWEPRVALDGGKEGLEVYERLLFQARDYLKKDAMMFFEIGIEQGDKLKKIVKKYLPGAKVEIKKDYGDIDRIATVSFKKG